MIREYYSVKDLQEIIGCGKDKAYKLMNSKSFPSIRIGKNRYVHKDKLYEWMETYTHKTFILK